MASKRSPPIDWEKVLAGVSRGNNPVEYRARSKIFEQGQPADSLLYLRRGKVKLSVTSKRGKKAILAIMNAGEFFGEGCLAGQQIRMATATAITACTLDKFEKPLISRMLRERREISRIFVANLLSRNLQYEARLVGRLFNSSEMRLARILLRLSHFGKESRAELMLPRISQANLAQMIGTTRSQLSQFMRKFRKLGFIHYGDDGGLVVQSGLLNIVLHD